MTEGTPPRVFGVTKVAAVDVIDNGGTVAARLVGSDGQEIALLIPQQVAADLQAHLSNELQAAQKLRPVSARPPRP